MLYSIKNYKYIKHISIIFIMLILASCGTLFTSKEQDVTIMSNSKDAKIYVNSELYGTGYANVKLNRKKSYFVRSELQGCRTYEDTISANKLNYKIFFNSFIFLFYFIDYATDSIFIYENNILIKNQCN